MDELALFPCDKPGLGQGPAAMVGDLEMSQVFTPGWIAPELWNAHFSDLRAGAKVCEPSCGEGHSLAAIPAQFDAFGVEIDPKLAERAARNTKRPVIVGDFFEVELPDVIDAFFGNPPFSLAWMDKFLDRIYPRLPEGGKAGVILSAHVFQTSYTVARWNQRYSLYSEFLPRDIFPGLQPPLSFCLFQKDTKPKLIGLRLFHEVSEMRDDLTRGGRKLLIESAVPAGRIWESAVSAVIRTRGGQAKQQEIYDAIGQAPPTATRWWKEKVRQTLYRYFKRAEPNSCVWLEPAGA